MPLPELQSLSPLHEEAALLLAQGHKQKEVAAHLQVAEMTLSRWKQSPLFEHKVTEFLRQIQAESLSYAQEKMGHMQVRAVDRLEYLIDQAESESVQLGAIREVLDRGPLKVQRGPSDGPVKGGIILEAKMLIAMRQVSEMIGDTEMTQALEVIQMPPVSESESPDAPDGLL
jgi:hypothetical protein